MKKNLRYLILLSICYNCGSLFAQSVRNCDLQIRLESPINNAVIPAGDTTYLGFTVLNAGPDTILATDTLWFWDRSRVWPFVAKTDIPANSEKQFGRTDLNNMYLTPYSGTTDLNSQVCLKLVNQSTISYGNGAGPLVTFEDLDTANNWSCANITFKAATSTAINIAYSGEPVEIYPNPTSGKVYIHGNVRSVTVFNFTGREMASFLSPTQIDLGQYEPGVYFLQLVNKDAKICSVQRIVKL